MRKPIQQPLGLRSRSTTVAELAFFVGRLQKGVMTMIYLIGLFLLGVFILAGMRLTVGAIRLAWRFAFGPVAINPSERFARMMDVLFD